MNEKCECTCVCPYVSKLVECAIIFSNVVFLQIHNSISIVHPPMEGLKHKWCHMT